jgi:hypothetical protein
MKLSAQGLIVAICLVVGVLASADAATANWLTVKNDSGSAIVLQETVVVNGKVKRGKAINLLPGETYREFLPAPTAKRVEVFDSRNRNSAAWSGMLDCKDATQAFAVKRMDGKVKVVAVESRR